MTLSTTIDGHRAGELSIRLRHAAEAVLIPVLALLGAGLLFAVFLLFLQKSPVEFFTLIWRGGFGSFFSWQNALLRATPLIFTALCVAIPARIGLIIIGGEGAFVLSGFCAAAAAASIGGLIQPWLVTLVMALVATGTGAIWIGLVGVMRYARGVNETISSLIMTYIAIAIMNFFVEGPLRDVSDPNRPSTKAISPASMIGAIPGLDVHWGLVIAVMLAAVLLVLMKRTTFGFAARITGGNLRVSLAQGLPVGRLLVASCAIGGACAGLAGFFEVAAVQGRASSALHAGYGFTGILVAFMARQNALAIVPVAFLFGGIAAAGGLVQRHMDLPDATVVLLQGVVFVVLLASETLHGRFLLFNPERRNVT